MQAGANLRTDRNIQLFVVKIIFLIVNKLDEPFIKRLVFIARGISRDMDPYELVNSCFEYLQKNWKKYENHPNLIAIAVLKMKNIAIDEFRRTKKSQSLTELETEKEFEIEDKNIISNEDRLEIKFKFETISKIIRNMGEKCREILSLAAEQLSMKEIQLIIGVNSEGTVLSRLSNCRKELRSKFKDD